MSLDQKCTILIEDVIVVSQQVSDVIICISGQDEIDEPIRKIIFSSSAVSFLSFISFFDSF